MTGVSASTAGGAHAGGVHGASRGTPAVRQAGVWNIGRELYGEADHAELPLPDELHPDAATHRRMGERFAALAFAPDGPFATRP
ncbi:predicted protein [Streptomyces albidoflavus]|nr:predicted protein [Streptomyces albidoflavus]